MACIRLHKMQRREGEFPVGNVEHVAETRDEIRVHADCFLRFYINTAEGCNSRELSACGKLPGTEGCLFCSLHSAIRKWSHFLEWIVRTAFKLGIYLVFGSIRPLPRGCFLCRPRELQEGFRNVSFSVPLAMPHCARACKGCSVPVAAAARPFSDSILEKSTALP
jgi:hypothetical protein